jgi:hypothetical protein
VGTESGNIINVLVQAKDVFGSNLSASRTFIAWLSASSTGAGTLNAVDVDLSINGGIGAVTEFVADKQIALTTSATGAVSLDITEATNAAAMYLAILFPNGELKVSGSIDFA